MPSPKPQHTLPRSECSTVIGVKTFYRLVGLVVVGAIAFVALGPLLPAGNPIGDASDAFLDALSAFWGQPITSVGP